VSKKHEKKRKELRSCEHRSDRRTAEFVVRQLGETQEQLCDLIAEMRQYDHYSEIEDVGWCLRIMQRLKTKYESFARDGVWSDPT
jgi:hypothetical protein